MDTTNIIFALDSTFLGSSLKPGPAH